MAIYGNFATISNFSHDFAFYRVFPSDMGPLKHSTLRFNLIDFQLNTDFPSQFCFFLPQNHLASVTQRSVSQENAYKKS